MQNSAPAPLRHLLAAGAVALLMGLVLWARLLPNELLAAEQWSWERVRQQVAKELDPRLPPAQKAAAVEALIRNNAQVVAEVRSELAESFRQDFTFVGEDGERHLYLLGDDSYYFLRQARNILDHGSACPTMQGGLCMDDKANAPLGRVMEKQFSPHPYAIAGLHRLITLVKHDQPLGDTAALAPTLLMVLAAPLVLLGLRRMVADATGAGPAGATVGATVGALLAAATILLSLPALGRSLGGDNDVWVILMPVFTLFLLARAADAGTGLGRRLSCGLLAGTLMGVMAGTWGGWHLFVIIFVTSLAGRLILGLLQRSFRGGIPGETGVIGVALLCLLAGTVVFALPFSGGADLLSAAWGDISGAVGLAGGLGGIDSAPEPNPFATVGELQKVPVLLMNLYFGPAAFALGVAGPLIALTPRVWSVPVRLGMAAAWVGVVAAIPFLWPDHGFRVLSLVVVLGSIALALAGLRRSSVPPVVVLTAAVWLFAGLFLSHNGQRYLLLLSTPLGLGIALALASLGRDLAPLLLGRLPARLRPAATGLAALSALVAVGLPLLQPGLNEAANRVPQFNRAWAEVLAAVRHSTPPDAVVTTWWDFGHWTAYEADRAVTVDGAGLRNRAIHWTGRVLTAPDPKEAAGLLRMLACGRPGGERAFEALVAGGLDRAEAFAFVNRAVTLERPLAELALTHAGMTAPKRQALLDLLYCAPPERVLLTTNLLMRTPAWGISGFWNSDLAWVVEMASHRKEEELQRAARTLGLSASAMDALIAQARSARDDYAKAALAAEDAVVWSTDWHRCAREPDGRLSCPLGLRSADGILLQRLDVDPAVPQGLTLDATMADGRRIIGQPGLVRLALPDRIEDLTPPQAAMNVAVIVDPQAARVFVASAGVARSLLARLVLLDGRYDGHWLEKMAQSTVATGETVTAWRVRQP